MSIPKKLFFKKILLFSIIAVAFLIFIPTHSVNASINYYTGQVQCGGIVGDPTHPPVYCTAHITREKLEYAAGEHMNVEFWLDTGSSSSASLPTVNFGGRPGVSNPSCTKNGNCMVSSTDTDNSFIATNGFGGLGGCAPLKIDYDWPGTYGPNGDNEVHKLVFQYVVTGVNGFCDSNNTNQHDVQLSSNPTDSISLGQTLNLNLTSSGFLNGNPLNCDITDKKDNSTITFSTSSYSVSIPYNDPNQSGTHTYQAKCYQYTGPSLWTLRPGSNKFFANLKQNIFSFIPRAMAAVTAWVQATSQEVIVSFASSQPTVTLQLGQSSVSPGGDTTVFWTSSNATSCVLQTPTMDPPPQPSGVPTATFNTGPVYQNTTYTVHCTNGSLTVDDSKMLMVTGFPDLVVTGWTGETNFVYSPGHMTFSLAAMVKNQGAISTGQGFYNFFQWSNVYPPNNPSATITDVPAGQGGISMVTLGAGVQAPMSLDNFSFPAAGTYYVRACADKKWSGDSGVIFEGDNEGNNCGDWTPITYGPSTGPDLIVVPNSVIPNQSTSGLISGQNISLSATIQNIGKVNITAPTYSPFVNLFQISDMDPSGAGNGMSKIPKPSFFARLIAKAFASNLPPSPPVDPTFVDIPTTPTVLPVNQGMTKSISAVHNFKYDGIYYIRACADKRDRLDDTGVIDETNEGNNCSDWTPITIGSASISGQCAIVAPQNGTIHYNCARGTSQNQVSGPTAWTWDCQGSTGTSPDYCSEAKKIMTGTLTPAKPSCMILSGQSSCSINFSWTVTNREKTTTYIVTPPPPSPYNLVHSSTLTSEVKVPLVVKYNSETFYLVNNLKNLAQSTVTSYCEPGSTWNTTSGKCKNNNLPDLTAGVISPTLVSTMDTITFSTTITNQGNASTGGSFFNLFQTVDKLPPSGIPDDNDVSDALGTTSISPSLGAGVSKNISASSQYITPNDPGTVYVRACADKKDKADTNGNISESNEKNNCGPWTLVTIVDQAVDGVCASTHYYCAPGNSTNNVAGSAPNNPWTWTCEGLGSGKNSQCSEPYGLNQCPSDSTGVYPDCVCKTGTHGTPGSCVCDNGATNPPTCDHFGDKKCPPGLTNYPACDVCENFADNPPDCDHFGKCPTGTVGIPPTNCMCLNFADNPPTCDHFGDCPSSTVGTPPKCTCKNNASNPPLCKKAPTYTER